MVSQSRWDNTRAYIFWMIKNIISPRGFDREVLEKKRSFLIYIGMTYPSLVTSFKGLHLTLDSWKDNRDDDGWKIKPENKVNPEYEIEEEEK